MNDALILEISDLKKSFGGIDAVDGITLNIEQGEIVGLIGPNGAGKTTLFNLISGFYPPDKGSIHFDGTELQEIMHPSKEETFIWTGSTGISFGLAGLGVAAGIGANLPTMAVATVLGIGSGVGTYLSQEQIKRRFLDYKRSRPFQVARSGLSRTFQITREFEGLTVEENLVLSSQDQHGENPLNIFLYQEQVSAEEENIRERANEVLQLLELEHLRTERAGNLSGGQRKLLELGRVLMTDPDLILLDEPVAGVNPTLTQNLLEQIRTLRQEGYTFLIVEHDMEVIMNISDRIIVMSEGQKLMEGTPSEVRKDQQVIDAYLGEL